MLYLDKSTLVGRGLHRECYRHPEHRHRCVKVVVAGNSDENRREAKYYSRLAARGLSWEMLARFYGLVETNLGEGAVFDLVCDYDGTISKSLCEYLDHPEQEPALLAMLQRALPDLKRYLLENRVVTMTLKSKNMLLQRVDADVAKLVIVDNVGNSDFIPLSHYVAGFGRLKIRRKWRRFERDLRDRYPASEAIVAGI